MPGRAVARVVLLVIGLSLLGGWPAVAAAGDPGGAGAPHLPSLVSAERPPVPLVPASLPGRLAPVVSRRTAAGGAEPSVGLALLVVLLWPWRARPNRRGHLGGIRSSLRSRRHVIGLRAPPALFTS